MNKRLATILALDIATLTGWATRTHAGVVHGTLDLTDLQHDYGHLGHVFGTRVADLITDHTPAILAVERPFYRGAGTRVYVLNGLAFTAQVIAWVRELRRVEYTASTVKKFSTGNGRATKADVVAAMRTQGFAPADDNEADAIALLLYAEDAERRAAAEAANTATPELIDTLAVG